MKTFLNLISAVLVFGFASANAAFTPEQKAAVIKAVTDAVASGDETQVKAAVSAQVAAFPELAGVIVTAGLKASSSNSIQNLIVKSAVWTAPSEINSIKNGIKNGLNTMTRAGRARYFALVVLASKTQSAALGNNAVNSTVRPAGGSPT